MKGPQSTLPIQINTFYQASPGQAGPESTNPKGHRISAGGLLTILTLAICSLSLRKLRPLASSS